MDACESITRKLPNLTDSNKQVSSRKVCDHYPLLDHELKYSILLVKKKIKEGYFHVEECTIHTLEFYLFIVNFRRRRKNIISAHFYDTVGTGTRLKLRIE